MTKFEQIQEDRLVARKYKDIVAATLLTTLVGEILAKAKTENREVPTEEETLKVISKFLAGNTEMQEKLQKLISTAIGLNLELNTNRLAEAKTEGILLTSYLPQKPKQLSNENIMKTVHELKANGATNIGAIMAHSKSVYADQYDPKALSQIAKEILA